MSYYGQDQNQNQSTWHQHSQPTSYNATSTQFSQQTNGTPQQNGGQRGPIGLNQAVGSIMTDLKSNLDKEYFKTVCGLLSGIEVIVSLIIFIIASNLQIYAFLTLISGFAFWISLLFLCVNLFQLPSKLPTVPFNKMQLGFCSGAAVLFLLEAIILMFYNFVLCLIVLHLALLFGYHSYDKLKEFGRLVNEVRQEQNPQQNINLNV